MLAAACHAAPAGGAAGDPPHGDGSAAGNGGDASAPTVASAGGKLTQAQIAATVNADGERLMHDGKYADAAKKFDEAHARDPVVTYYINDCTALRHTGDLELALHVCQGCRTDDATPAQRSQVEQLIKDIIQAGKAKGLELCDGCIYEAPPDPPPH